MPSRSCWAGCSRNSTRRQPTRSFYGFYGTTRWGRWSRRCRRSCARWNGAGGASTSVAPSSSSMMKTSPVRFRPARHRRAARRIPRSGGPVPHWGRPGAGRGRDGLFNLRKVRLTALARVHTDGPLFGAMRAATWTMGGAENLITSHLDWFVVQPRWKAEPARIPHPGLRFPGSNPGAPAN
jgi:hypothetical protein